jgi:hypothetical protein
MVLMVFQTQVMMKTVTMGMASMVMDVKTIVPSRQIQVFVPQHMMDKNYMILIIVGII